ADYEVSDEDEILNINDLEPLSDEEGKDEFGNIPTSFCEFEFENVVPCRYKIMDNYSGEPVSYSGQWAFDTREEQDLITKRITKM
ncbi:unnamed protein product, partial [Didymodactylos carnosus]